jgi:hypothetical protein
LRYFIDLNIDTNDIEVKDCGVYIPSDGIAKDNDAFLLLEYKETRNLIISDLFRVSSIFSSSSITLKNM